MSVYRWMSVAASLVFVCLVVVTACISNPPDGVSNVMTAAQMARVRGSAQCDGCEVALKDDCNQTSDICNMCIDSNSQKQVDDAACKAVVTTYRGAIRYECVQSPPKNNKDCEHFNYTCYWTQACVDSGTLTDSACMPGVPPTGQCPNFILGRYCRWCQTTGDVTVTSKSNDSCVPCSPKT